MEGEPEIDVGAYGMMQGTERNPDGGPVLSGEGENLLRAFPDVSMVLGPSSDRGCGTIYITNRRLFWLSGEDPERGYFVDFESISVHAISRDPDSEGNEHPCIYLQIDVAENDDGDDDNDFTPEVRLVPADQNCHTYSSTRGSVQDIFDTMCDAAAANTAPEDDDNDDMFYDKDEVEAGAAAEREAMLDRLGNMLVGPEDVLDELIVNDPSRFEDPDDDDNDEADMPKANGTLHPSETRNGVH